MSVPRHRLVLLRSGIVALALLAFPGTAAAHAQLVSSSPGSGELVPVAPAEARLVFSEPAEPRYTGADLLDAQGRVVGLGLGELDPTDPRQLVIRLPTLADGAYSVSWHAVSAADGHETNGFVTFAVGDTPLPPDVGAYDPGSSGDIHGGHSGGTALAETQGRAGSYLGLMLALGLAPMGWLVVRPAVGSLPPGFVFSQAAALLVAGVASGLLALSGGEAFTSMSSDATGGGDTLGFLLASRTGLLLGSRTLVALGAAVVVFLLARPRPSWGLAVGFGGAGIGVALTAAGSHAAAFGSVAPILAQGVHMGAAGVWLAGLVVFAGGLATGALKRHDLGRLVPRFSALALVSVAILSLTGVYNAWLETGELLPLGTGYAGALLVKVLLFLAAIVLGALNFLERPRALVARLPFARRVAVEAAFALGVVVATALLASGSPPAGVRPVAIAPASADAVTDASGSVASAASGAALGMQPARPGPDRFTVQLADEPPADSVVELRLQRLDRDQGLSTLRLARAPGPDPLYGTSGGSLAAGSRWDATVVVVGADGTELGRRRFSFALDAAGLSEGRAMPPVDPALAVALVLIALGVLALSYGVAGGRLPRTEPVTGRVSLLTGGAAALIVGLVMTVGGPRP